MGRKAHRQALVSLLQSSAPVTALVASSSIYDSRSTAIPKSAVPAVVVDVDQTIRRRESGHQLPTFRVTHQFLIDCFASGTTDPGASALADDIAEAVAEAVLTDVDFMDRFESIGELTDQMAWDSSADGRRRLVRVRFEAMISACFEPTVTDDFSTLHIDVDMIDPGGSVDPSGNPIPDGTVDAELTLEDLDT